MKTWCTTPFEKALGFSNLRLEAKDKRSPETYFNKFTSSSVPMMHIDLHDSLVMTKQSLPEIVASDRRSKGIDILTQWK